MSDSYHSLDRAPRTFPLPTISEDTLDYSLHLLPSSDPYALATLVTQHVESLLIQPWLWNKDAWELKVAPPETESPAGSSSIRLEGRMRVGDAVDDEWLVVWLLRSVSQKWPELVIRFVLPRHYHSSVWFADASCSIRDTDGEFLLIEAANELPSWVSPENADNRVWLMGGNLHLLPLSVRSDSSLPRPIPDDEADERAYDPEAYISPEDAVRAVRMGNYRADERMERAVWDRIKQYVNHRCGELIRSYPAGLKGHLHRAKAYLPVNIAKALAKSPELVQKAIEGFYVRDPAQLRVRYDQVSSVLHLISYMSR
jgi:hypothetical protein